ncbi:hypothetical protein [Haloferula sp. BvORR071]|uniref:hypothetical protein n=1 Tax=Haloferula sp. BvORR071 TaxID=1396141 RepID=UPI00055332DA|nr:hypothetical protein [Haloferula sp. BvORR071]
MKLPFPYAIAAEFVLFREWAKVTLPHMLVLWFALGAGAIGFAASVKEWGVVLAAMLAMAICAATGYCVFRLFHLVLPTLRMLVRLGIVALPNRHLMKRKVRSYCGHRDY